VRPLLAALCGLLLASATAARADIAGVVPKKLILLDRIAASGKAKALFLAKDAGAHKGTGTDAATIGAQVDVAWGTTRGSFVMPAGAHDGRAAG
jgi:hypothetical protein